MLCLFSSWVARPSDHTQLTGAVVAAIGSGGVATLTVGAVPATRAEATAELAAQFAAAISQLDPHLIEAILTA